MSQPISAALLCAFCLICTARAAQSQPAAADIGDSPSALPGIVRVPVGGKNERLGLGGAATAGYGFTESVVAASDTSHRVFGSVAGSFRATDWFAFAIRFDGRYDWHKGVPGGNGGGGVGDPSVLFRVGTTMNDLKLGAEARIVFPGGKAPSLRVSAVSPELSLLAAYAAPSGALTLASRVGFRIDRSAETLGEVDRLSLADRMSLGVSDTNALLLGVGLSARVAKGLDAIGEFTWDVRVPSKGVGAAQSPMRLDAGARLAISEALAFDLVVEASPGARPTIAAGAPVAVVEPRVGMFAGIHFRPSLPPVEVAPPPVPKVETPPEVVAAGRIEGRVTDEGGAPIEAAKIHIGKPDSGLDVKTGDAGQFESNGVPAGQVEITIAADGYRDETRTVDVTSTQAARVEIQLARALPVGQIRGLARSFSGQAIKATVRIEPIGKEAVVGEGGKFEVDVPPGEYDVIVKASGYSDQHRHVRVEANGVVVLDLDMRTRR